MQSVCSVLPTEQWQQVIDARALGCEDPALGAIYDPPFAHFTHQLAEEYDWDGLAPALVDFARQQKPFEVRTTGIQVFAAADVVTVVAVLRSEHLVEYHKALWQVVSRYASGNIPAFYEPNTWVPHVTIKRCGTQRQSFGNFMAELAQRRFAWTFLVDNVSVQCDPGHNSRTHYQRLCYRLGDGTSFPDLSPDSNASILKIDAVAGDAPEWRLDLQPDNGPHQIVSISAPDLTRLMADARCSEVHFAGGRCHIEGDRIISVVPNAPHAVVG